MSTADHIHGYALAEAVAARVRADEGAMAYVRPDRDIYDGSLAAVIDATVQELAARGLLKDKESDHDAT